MEDEASGDASLHYSSPEFPNRSSGKILNNHGFETRSSPDSLAACPRALPSISPIPSARFTDNADDENDEIRMTNDKERGKSLNSYPRQSATALARNRSIWRAELCDA